MEVVLVSMEVMDMDMEAMDMVHHQLNSIHKTHMATIIMVMLMSTPKNGNQDMEIMVMLAMLSEDHTGKT